MDEQSGMVQGTLQGEGNYLLDREMKTSVNERLQKLTVRDNIEQQIARAKAEVVRLEGIRDRMAPALLDQRIMDLRQAMQF